VAALNPGEQSHIGATTAK